MVTAYVCSGSWQDSRNIGLSAILSVKSFSRHSIWGLRKALAGYRRRMGFAVPVSAVLIARDYSGRVRYTYIDRFERESTVSAVPQVWLDWLKNNKPFHRT